MLFEGHSVFHSVDSTSANQGVNLAEALGAPATAHENDDGGGAVSEPDRRCALTDLHWASTRRRQLRRRGRLRRRRRRLPRPSTRNHLESLRRECGAAELRLLSSFVQLQTNPFSVLLNLVVYIVRCCTHTRT